MENKENGKENINENEQNSKEIKKGFFKKVWYSITKIEKYGTMAAEGVPKALTYLMKLALIIAIIVGIQSTVQVSNIINEIKGYIENNISNFNYEDGILSVENEETVTIENTSMGKIIIDTKTEDNDLVNSYLNSITEGSGVVVLKNQFILKDFTTSGTVSYKYENILSQMQITSLSKQDVLDYVNSNQIWSIYISIFGMILIYIFVYYILSLLWNAIIMSIFGYLATWFAKIKMRYAAVFNMSAYSLTLSVVLNIIYIIVNCFIDFEIKYFQVMYFAVAAIYLIAAIFIIKSDFIKRQIEITKMIEIKKQEEKIKEEKQDEKQDEKQEKNPKEGDKKPNEKSKDKEKDNDKKEDGQEPEGSEA